MHHLVGLPWGCGCRFPHPYVSITSTTRHGSLRNTVRENAQIMQKFAKRCTWCTIPTSRWAATRALTSLFTRLSASCWHERVGWRLWFKFWATTDGLCVHLLIGCDLWNPKGMGRVCGLELEELCTSVFAVLTRPWVAWIPWNLLTKEPTTHTVMVTYHSPRLPAHLRGCPQHSHSPSKRTWSLLHMQAPVSTFLQIARMLFNGSSKVDTHLELNNAVTLHKWWMILLYV